MLRQVKKAQRKEGGNPYFIQPLNDQKLQEDEELYDLEDMVKDEPGAKTVDARIIDKSLGPERISGLQHSKGRWIHLSSTKSSK